jgi:hypothetical protein
MTQEQALEFLSSHGITAKAFSAYTIAALDYECGPIIKRLIVFSASPNGDFSRREILAWLGRPDE